MFLVTKAKHMGGAVQSHPLSAPHPSSPLGMWERENRELYHKRGSSPKHHRGSPVSPPGAKPWAPTDMTQNKASRVLKPRVPKSKAQGQCPATPNTHTCTILDSSSCSPHAAGSRDLPVSQKPRILSWSRNLLEQEMAHSEGTANIRTLDLSSTQTAPLKKNEHKYSCSQICPAPKCSTVLLACFGSGTSE